MTGKRHGGAVIAQTDAGISQSASKARSGGRSRSPANSRPGLVRRLRDPRSAVLVLMAAVLLIGGGRKLLRALRGRRAVGRLDDPGVSPESIAEAAEYGRAGLFDLFRILGSADGPDQRAAAGRAIARLWAEDQLVSEEEQAFARRAFEVDWQARRRYPRELRAEIPIVVTYGVPLLEEAGAGVAPRHLEWSHRIVGARRAALEEDSPWTPGHGRAEFTIFPEDFVSDGPHQIVLETKVRTVGLTGPWQIELPKMPFRFDFDPNLAVTSLLTLPDDARGQIIRQAVQLETSPAADGESARPLPIHHDLVIRNPPWIVIDLPLPCDLAHRIELEIEGVAGRFPAGRVILSGQGGARTQSDGSGRSTRRFPLGAIAGVDPSLVERPGRRRIRVGLKADPSLGWGDPSIRSIWPGEIESAWLEVEISRR